MESLFDDLHGVGAESPGFAPSLRSRAFLLSRKAGNILVYSSGRIFEEAEALQAHGPILRQYLNHQHQALATCDWVAERFGAPLFVPGIEQAEVARICRVGGTFSGRAHHFPDFEAIPIPGHTPGSTCFLWTGGSRRYLFTGDTIYLRDGEWLAAMLEDSDRSAYLRSLDLIRKLEFDVLVPGLARGAAVQATDSTGTTAHVEQIMRRLEAGADR